MKYLMLTLMMISTHLFSAPYILSGSGIYKSGRCEVFFLKEEESKKIWVISFPKNEGEDSPINDLVANQVNYNGMGEIIDLNVHGFDNLKGFKLFIRSMNEKVNFSIKTKTHIKEFEAVLPCQ